jgi:hypothetical protein
VIAAEPALGREIVGEELDLALEAIGEFAELKSPSTMGHVHAVRELVTVAAVSFGLPDVDVAELRRAGCVYDLGRLGVPTRSGTSRARSHGPSSNSNVYEPASSSWELRATPAEDGSTVEMIWIREFARSARGRIFGILFRLIGKLIFTREATRTIRNLERLAGVPTPARTP